MAGTSVLGYEAVKEALNISNKVQEKACIMAFAKDIQGVQSRWASFETIMGKFRDYQLYCLFSLFFMQDLVL